MESRLEWIICIPPKKKSINFTVTKNLVYVAFFPLFSPQFAAIYFQRLSHHGLPLMNLFLSKLSNRRFRNGAVILLLFNFETTHDFQPQTTRSYTPSYITLNICLEAERTTVLCLALNLW